MGKKVRVLTVFDFIRKGDSLYAACLKSGMTTKEFYQVLAKEPDYHEEYRLALADYADQCTDYIRKLVQDLQAGEIDTSTAKLLIETQKWLAQKASPEPYENSVDNATEKTTEIVVKFV